MSRWKKTFLWALLAAVAVLLAPVLLTDRSAEGRITRQFPWEFHPEVGGAFIREELVIADCTFTITASHLAADESLIDGERLVLRLADVDGNAATAGNGFITLPLTAGRFATCAKVTDAPAARLRQGGTIPGLCACADRSLPILRHMVGKTPRRAAFRPCRGCCGR
jgi:hypothetical protein